MYWTFYDNRDDAYLDGRAQFSTDNDLEAELHLQGNPHATYTVSVTEDSRRFLFDGTQG